MATPLPPRWPRLGEDQLVDEEQLVKTQSKQDRVMMMGRGKHFEEFIFMVKSPLVEDTPHSWASQTVV